MIGQMWLAAGKISSSASQSLPNLRDFLIFPTVYDGRARSRDFRAVTIPTMGTDYKSSAFRDLSFSNGAHMQPIDFRYRLSDQGRIVLGPLSSEETLEFEELSRRDREGLIDLPSELRLLELYVKYNGLGAQAPLAPLELALESACQVSETPRRRRLPPPRPSRPRNYVVPMIVMMGMSFMLIALFIS